MHWCSVAFIRCEDVYYSMQSDIVIIACPFYKTKAFVISWARLRAISRGHTELFYSWPWRKYPKKELTGRAWRSQGSHFFQLPGCGKLGRNCWRNPWTAVGNAGQLQKLSVADKQHLLQHTVVLVGTTSPCPIGQDMTRYCSIVHPLVATASRAATHR